MRSRRSRAGSATSTHCVALQRCSVLWLHVSNSYRGLSSGSEWLDWFISNIDVGRIGVVVFFLISGFVIPFSIRPDSAAP